MKQDHAARKADAREDVSASRAATHSPTAQRPKRHVNIPIFIPHLGCPNDCVFCNQRKISGKSEFRLCDVRPEIERALATVNPDADVEIAFFGGSFTGIDRGDMLYLLNLADEYIQSGRVGAIRLSTRPDYIDREILDILRDHHVTDIELGIQSMSDRVLGASKRGHTAETSRAACKLIAEYGFNLVGQMMVGLPLSTREDELATADEISRLCGAARIYPTVVFRDTELCDMLGHGYTPLSLDEAVSRSADLLELFAERRIKVIRVGLCASENLTGNNKSDSSAPTDGADNDSAVVAGDYHSAVGELAYNELYYRKIKQYIDDNHLADRLSGKNIVIETGIGETSKTSGQHRKNKLRLQNEYNVNNIKIIENPELFWYNIRIRTF